MVVQGSNNSGWVLCIGANSYSKEDALGTTSLDHVIDDVMADKDKENQ